MSLWYGNLSFTVGFITQGHKRMSFKTSFTTNKMKKKKNLTHIKTQGHTYNNIHTTNRTTHILNQDMRFTLKPTLVHNLIYVVKKTSVNKGLRFALKPIQSQNLGYVVKQP